MSVFQLSFEGAVAVLTQDDGKANTFTQAEFEELLARLDEVEKSDAGALLLRGRAGYFSAGLNLKHLPSLDMPGWHGLLGRFGQSVLRLFLFPRPVVAEVTGHAIGAGAMFALAADVRIFAQGPLKFGLNEVPNGMPVPAYGVEVARAAIAPADQAELILHGRMVSPEEALALRIAERVEADPHKVALERASALAQLPSVPYALTKQNLRGAAARMAEQNITAEVERFVAALKR
jgi:enoyl-CoA hydratase